MVPKVVRRLARSCRRLSSSSSSSSSLTGNVMRCGRASRSAIGSARSAASGLPKYAWMIVPGVTALEPGGAGKLESWDSEIREELEVVVR